MKEFRARGVYTFDGVEYPTVTTILGVIAKPALVGWAAKTVAKEAARKAAAGEEVDEATLAGLPFKVRDAKSEVGSSVHSVLEAYALGQKVMMGVLPGEVVPYAEGLIGWLESYQPKITHSETTVFRKEPRYAGTFDALMELGGQSVLVDVKTGKAVYKEVALQLAAYRHADFIGRADGTTLPMPPVDRLGVLHVTPNGTELVFVNEAHADIEVFFAARMLWAWANDFETVCGEV